MKFAVILILLSCLIEGVAVAETASDSIKSSMNTQAPVLINSETLNLDAKERIFTYKGDVRIVQGDLTITTDIMVGQYQENEELDTILCKGNVVVTKGNELRATANRAFYDVVKGEIELTEEPELNKAGSILAADKITVFVNEDRSEAEGNVRVKVQKEGDSGLGKILKGRGGS